jgi:hypothetical protein
MMTIGILVTNNGPHPADKWAEATASNIVDIAEHLSGEKRGAAIKLQASIIDILEGHHSTIQTGERGKIAEHGHDRLQHELDPAHHLDVDAVTAEIIAASSGTPWEADFAKPETAAHLKELLTKHFKTSMHIERSWHADRNSNTEQTEEFREAHNIGGAK